jgi:tetratricopeptide (TPR) repeat protein
MDDLTVSNLGGKDSVSGTIFLPNRRPAGRGILVKFNKGGSDAMTWTDTDGKFFFNGVGNGTYTLTAEAGEEFESASQRLEITEARPSHPQTHYVSIQLRLKPNSTPKAVVVDADLARMPKKAQQNYLDARDASAKGDHQRAVEKYLLAIAEFPNFAIAHGELGTEYLNLNQLERSAEHLSIALKLKPGAYEALANLGTVLVRLKKFAEAESMLRESLKLKDDSAVVHFYLGRALAGQNRPDEAEREFRTALNTGGSKMIEAHRALANLYLQRGEDAKALSELEAYLEANPKPSDEKKIRDTIQQIKESLKENRKR